MTLTTADEDENEDEEAMEEGEEDEDEDKEEEAQTELRVKDRRERGGALPSYNGPSTRPSLAQKWSFQGCRVELSYNTNV